MNLLTNLVGYYAFENNVLDSHTGGHNGAVVGSPVYVPGVQGDAIDFVNNASANYVNVANTADYSFTDGVADLPFSISYWVYAHAISTTGNFIFNKREDAAGPRIEYQVQLRTNNAPAMVLFSNGGTTAFLARAAADNTITLNNWHHVVITYDGAGIFTGIKIYVDNVDESGIDLSTGTYAAMSLTTSQQRIGQAGWTTSQALKHRGRLDEMGIWKDRVLTPAEISFLYNGGAGRSYAEL